MQDPYIEMIRIALETLPFDETFKAVLTFVGMPYAWSAMGSEEERMEFALEQVKVHFSLIEPTIPAIRKLMIRQKALMDELQRITFNQF